MTEKPVSQAERLRNQLHLLERSFIFPAIASLQLHQIPISGIEGLERAERVSTLLGRTNDALEKGKARLAQSGASMYETLVHAAYPNLNPGQIHGEEWAKGVLAELVGIETGEAQPSAEWIGEWEHSWQRQFALTGQMPDAKPVAVTSVVTERRPMLRPEARATPEQVLSYALHILSERVPALTQMGYSLDGTGNKILELTEAHWEELGVLLDQLDEEGRSRVREQLGNEALQAVLTFRESFGGLQAVPVQDVAAVMQGTLSLNHKCDPGTSLVTSTQVILTVNRNGSGPQDFVLRTNSLEAATAFPPDHTTEVLTSSGTPSPMIAQTDLTERRVAAMPRPTKASKLYFPGENGDGRERPSDKAVRTLATKFQRGKTVAGVVAELRKRACRFSFGGAPFTASEDVSRRFTHLLGKGTTEQYILDGVTRGLVRPEVMQQDGQAARYLFSPFDMAVFACLQSLQPGQPLNAREQTALYVQVEQEMQSWLA